MSVRPQVTPPSTSTRRRKPSIIYRSPSVEFVPYPLNNPNASVTAQDEPMVNGNTSPYSPAHEDLSSSTSSPSPPTPSTSSLPSVLNESSSTSSFAKPLSTREVYAMAPPLPLYHPLGALALRLPPLGESPKTPHTQLVDPTPSKPIQTAASNRPRNSTGANRSRNSGRSRKTTTTKPRDLPADTVDPLIADEKDKDQDEYVATHRRRRGGPSASVSLSASAQVELIAAEGRKRKRREADTGDPGVSPPISKRSRQPRAGTSVGTPNNPASPTPSSVQLKDETPDAMEVEEDEEPPVSARTNGRRRNAKSGGRRNSARRVGPKKEKERTPSSDELSYGQRSAADPPQADEVSGELAKETEVDGDSPSGEEAIVSSHSPPIVAPVPTHLTKNALEDLSMSAANVGDRMDGAGPAYI